MIATAEQSATRVRRFKVNGKRVARAAGVDRAAFREFPAGIETCTIAIGVPEYGHEEAEQIIFARMLVLPAGGLAAAIAHVDSLAQALSPRFAEIAPILKGVALVDEETGEQLYPLSGNKDDEDDEDDDADDEELDVEEDDDALLPAAAGDAALLEFESILGLLKKLLGDTTEARRIVRAFRAMRQQIAVRDELMKELSKQYREQVATILESGRGLIETFRTAMDEMSRRGAAGG